MSLSLDKALKLGGLAAGAYTAYSGSRAAGDAADAQRASLGLSRSAINQQLKFDRQDRKDFRPITLQSARLALDSARKDREFYDQYIRPTQKEFIDTAREDIKPRYDEVTRDAALEAEQQFDNAEARLDRDLTRRGVDPAQGKGLRRATAMDRAATRSHAITNAAENEQRRVEDLEFSRLASVLGQSAGLRTPQAVRGMPTGGTGSAASDSRYLASQYGDMASDQRSNTAETIASGIDLFDRVKDFDFGSFFDAFKGGGQGSQQPTSGVWT